MRRIRDMWPHIQDTFTMAVTLDNCKLRRHQLIKIEVAAVPKGRAMAKAVASAIRAANLLCQKYVVAGHRGKERDRESVCERGKRERERESKSEAWGKWENCVGTICACV